MRPEKGMQRVVGGNRYTVATATLLAHDEYWDGHNFERHGRNTFLYKTRGGLFFRVTITQWDGERDTITPITEDEAKELYEALQECTVDYETAFGPVVEEASTSGRPTLYDGKLKQTAVWMPEEMITWLKSQGNMSDIIRGLVEKAMINDTQRN